MNKNGCLRIRVQLNADSAASPVMPDEVPASDEDRRTELTRCPAGLSDSARAEKARLFREAPFKHGGPNMALLARIAGQQ